jgi:hypothetical protein
VTGNFNYSHRSGREAPAAELPIPAPRQVEDRS